MSRIPFVDLGWQHRQIAAEIEAGFAEVMSTGAFILGPAVEQFESEFAVFCGTRHCVGVANGTDALELALRAAGIDDRDSEVILPANTFVASAEAVVRAGATPVFVDVDPSTALVDLTKLADAIGSRTRAVLPVDLYGQVAAIPEIRAMVRGRDIAIIEDAAQAQGARRDGQRAGSFGDIAGTSFYPGKNLGAYGDAGAVLTDAADCATALRQLRNHGGDEGRYRHDRFGVNSRLDTLQAVVLRAKLHRLDEWNALRRDAARRYDEMLSGVPDVTVLATDPENEPVFHLYVLRSPARDDIVRDLTRAEIGVGIHYPASVHLLPAFTQYAGGRGAFPEAEALAEEVVSLPMFPGITTEQQERVAAIVAKAMR
jgi:dTDP-4-amino-4,6-dideoxygalactose transaminase